MNANDLMNANDFSGRIRSAVLCGDPAGVMQVGLIKALREPASSTSACRDTKLCTFFEQAVLALCCQPRKVVRDMPVGLLDRLVVGQTTTHERRGTTTSPHSS